MDEQKEIRCPTCGQLDMIQLPSLLFLEQAIRKCLIQGSYAPDFPAKLAFSIREELIESGLEDIG